MTNSVDSVTNGAVDTDAPAISRFHWMNWSGFLLAFIQSVCSAFIALHGIRFLVGIGAVVLASSAWQIAEHLHINAIRVPMMLIALIAALLNLAALWQVRRLHRRSASAWRQQPVSPAKRRSQALQLVLSLVTLVLLVGESLAHLHLKGTL